MIKPYFVPEKKKAIATSITLIEGFVVALGTNIKRANPTFDWSIES